MSLLGFFGFDDNVPEPGGTALAINTNAGRLGGGAVSAPYTGKQIINVASHASGVIGFAIQGQAMGNVDQGFRLYEGSFATLHLSVGSNGTHWVVRNGAGAVIITTTVPSVINTWYFLELKYTIHDTTGFVELKINGVVAGSFSGDTRNGGAVGAIGSFALYALQAGAGNSTYLDDMYILDSADGTATQGAPFNDYLGDVRVETVEPSGNGDSTQWTGSDGNSVDNYQLVDEDLTSTTDYVAASVAAKKDLYPFADVNASSTVLAHQAVAYAAKSDAGVAPAASLITKGDGGTERTEVSLAGLSTSYLLFNGPLRFTDPDGDPITTARLNAMQVGLAT